MRQGFMVSRRKAVTLVAGTLAASAGSAVTRVTPAVSNVVDGGSADAAALMTQSHRRMVDLLQEVRQAHGATSRTAAFQHLASALRMHEIAEMSVRPIAPRGNMSATTLYRHREPGTVLANVIARELEASPYGAAWMTRFADLEAVIHARAAACQRSTAGGAPIISA